MESVDTSNHMCLICNQTIIGLLNYVDHFKSHATPQDGHIVEQKVSSWDLKQVIVPCPGDKTQPEAKKHGTDSTAQHTAQGSGSYSADTSPLPEFIDNNDDFTDADLDTDTLISQRHCPDFFQSLELKSATDEPAPRQKIKAVQKLSIFEDDQHAESLLPISSILSHLNFSSDEELLAISDNEADGQQSNEDSFWLSEDERYSSHPPQGHTGGKWNPGEGPKRRMPIAGKWKPGEGPGPACRKNIVKRTRGAKSDAGKTFYCNVCNSCYSNRITYSLHFSQAQHKQLAEEKKNAKAVPDFLEENGRLEEAAAQAQHKQAVGVDDGSGKAKNRNNVRHCQVCDLYFDNANVFSIHCETKLHKDATLKRGFREYKGSDGSIIRIDVNNETISKDDPNDLWCSLAGSLRSSSLTCFSDGKETETHQCNICDKQFKRKYEMARHLLTRMHRVRALKNPEADSVEMLNKYNKYMTRLSPFQCGVCQYYFNRQRDFLDHMGSSLHLMTCQEMLGPILCVPCKYKTHKHNEMMEHLHYPDHFAAVEKKHGICIVRESHTRITCKFCGVKMYSAVRMRRHCQQRHADRLTEVQVTMFVKPVEFNVHKCPLCEKSFRAKSLLQFHFLKVHRSMSLFNCAVCSRGYLDQRRLDNHLRTRFHAKRVIANKLKEAQKVKVAALKEQAALGVLKRKRGRPRLADKLKPPKRVEPLVLHVKKPLVGEYVDRPRRSTRKRKIMEFFDDDDDDDESEKEKSKKEKKEKTNTKLSKVKESLPDSKQVSAVCGTVKRPKGRPSKKVKENTVKADTTAKGREPHSSDPIQSHTDNTSVDVKPEHRPVTDDESAASVGDDDDDGSSFDSEDEMNPDIDDEKLMEASKHIFSCTYCDFAATDLTELRGHYNENHPNDILACQPCNQYFLSLKAYKIHCSGRGHQLKLREQSGETKMHKCPMCEKRFLQESCCLLHLETVHRHPSCEADLQRLNKGQDLVTQLYGDHVKQVECLSNDTSVSCPECGKFVRKDTLVEHLRLHTGERPYTCRFCSKGFAGRLTLRRHISSHLNMPMFMCDTCGREFKRNNHLIKHLRQHDFEKRGESYVCQVCKACFFTPEELARHMRRHGDRNYKCTWPGCHWTFVLSGELKSHMFTHTGEKKYLCDSCGFGAPTKTRLRRHVKTHDKSRNFNCDYCPYKASCKTHLKRHMRIHINSRPFACPYCNYTCNTHENIRKHILKTQKHKGMKLYPCKLCGNFGCDSSKEFRAHLMTVHENYLKENAVDSLAVFSGLYKREEDYQKPKEGSEIIQVTKGRFFRSYQNPGAPIEPPKPKKPKKTAHKMEEVKVHIVPPSELERDILGSDPKEKEPKQTMSVYSEEHKPLMQQQDSANVMISLREQHTESEHEEESPDGEVDQEVENAQYIEVPNMVIHTFNSQQTQPLPSATTFSIQPQAQQLPVTVTLTDDKLYWTVVPDQKVILPQTSAPEPWYSGMPQVHAPTTQELQQYSHPGNLLPANYFCNIPVGDIQSIQNTVSGQIYTGIVENIVVLNDPTRTESASL